MTGIKKYISLFLLSGILFGSSGYYLYFKYLQYNIKHRIKKEIKSGIYQNRLTVFVVPASETDGIEWVKRNEEFKYKECLYDVVKTEVLNGKKYIYCINDSKENELITGFLRNSKRRNKILLRLIRILSNKYIVSGYTGITVDIVSCFRFNEYRKIYYPRTVDIPSPPPKSGFFI